MVKNILEKFDDLINEKKCPECSGEIILTSFEKTCKECGLVINEFFGETSYIFNDKKIKSNLNKQYVALGKQTNFIGGLGTFIDFESSNYLKDKAGKLLSPDNQKLFKRLKRNYTQSLRLKNHETEYRILNILNKISLYLNLNKNIRNSAAYYYQKITKKEKKVINNISLIAFCVFYAAKKESHNAPITIKEISDAFQSFGHRVNSRLILRDGIRYKKYLCIDSIPHTSESYLIRLINNVSHYTNLENRLNKKGCFWSKDEYQNKLNDRSRTLLKSLDTNARGGRNPFILTGAIIYLADKLLAKEYNYKTILTQKIISESTKIAEYSIRDHYVNLLKPIFMKK